MDRLKLDGIFFRIQQSLRKSVSKLVTNPQDIDDVVQETYLRAIASKTSNSIKDPVAYLFRTSRNIALNEKAKIYRRIEVALPPEEMDAFAKLLDEPATENDAYHKQLFADFCLAVSELPLQCRRVFILRKVYGFSQSEISKKLGISVSTVETHTSKGMYRTRQIMAKHKSGNIMFAGKQLNKNVR